MSDQEIFRLAGILAEDPTAIEKRERILGRHLGLPLVSLQALSDKHRYDADYFGYFMDGLTKFWSGNPNATVGRVLACLRALELNSAAGKLVHITSVWLV